MPAYTIENANKEHLDAIVDIANSHSLEQLPKDKLKDGFLISGFCKKDYEEFIEYAEYFYVIKEASEIIGFLLAYSDSKIKDNEWLNMKMKEEFSFPFVLGKQLAVRKGKSAAHLLLRHFFKETQGLPIFMIIVLEPLNVKSIRFHELFGFKKVMEVVLPDGGSRGIWKRDPE